MLKQLQVWWDRHGVKVIIGALAVWTIGGTVIFIIVNWNPPPLGGLIVDAITIAATTVGLWLACKAIGAWIDWRRRRKQRDAA